MIGESTMAIRRMIERFVNFVLDRLGLDEPLLDVGEPCDFDPDELHK